VEEEEAVEPAGECNVVVVGMELVADMDYKEVGVGVEQPELEVDSSVAVAAVAANGFDFHRSHNSRIKQIALAEVAVVARAEERSIDSRKERQELAESGSERLQLRPSMQSNPLGESGEEADQGEAGAVVADNLEEAQKDFCAY
jgi:hypothetical protein